MRRTIITIACLAGAAGCALAPGGRDSELTVGQVPMWSATLAPAAGGTVRGSATVVGTGGSRTRVVVTVEGSANGSLHPWDFHEGRCGSNGSIVGRASDYPPIPIGGSGAATMSLEIPATLRSRGDYYIDVHESFKRYRTVTCGALERVGASVVADRDTR